MDRLHAMVVFVAVADTGGFAPAARKLNLSPPAVTRAIAALEDRLGTSLFHRTTRLVRLTEPGSRFLDDCRRILGDIEEAEESVAGAHREARGCLAVTASMMFGRMFVAPLLLEFLERHPQVVVQTLFVDRVVNLLEEGLDVAVRIGELPDSSYTAIRVGSVRRVICAAPAYLEARGVPQHPSELADHDSVLFSGLTPQPQWAFTLPDGETRVRLNTRLAVNTADVAIAAARAGKGLTRVLSYQITPELRENSLCIVMADYEPPPWPIHIVYHQGRKAPARVRAFVDFAVPLLRSEPALN